MKKFYLFVYALIINLTTSVWSPVMANCQFFEAIKFEDLAKQALQAKRKSQTPLSIDSDQLQKLQESYAEFLEKNFSADALEHARTFFSKGNCEAAKVIKFKQEMQAKAMAAIASLLSKEPELLPEHANTHDLLKTAFTIMADLHTVLKWIDTSSLVRRLTPEVHVLMNELKLDAQQLQEFLISKHGAEFVLKSCRLENEIGKIFNTWQSSLA